MIHRLHRSATSLAIVLISGCSLAGAWRATDHEPAAKHIAIDVMTFDGDRFTATSCVDREQRSMVGQYEVRGGRLTLHPTSGPEQTYRCRRKLGGTLELSQERNGRPVWETFRKVDETHP